MNHLDLFAGIGGFHLAGEWVWGKDFNTICHVEIDNFCQKILKKHWPDVPIISDIKEYNHNGATIDLLTGGFPCQPFSCAGKQRGKEDDRYLWPEMLRVISEVRPTWIIGENVAGIINMGLEQVLSDLEGENYEVQSFIIPACAKNAPHRRDRVWIVANSRCSNGKTCNSNGMGDGKRGPSSQASLSNNNGATSDSQKTERKPLRRTRTGREGFTNDNKFTPNSKNKRLEGRNRERAGCSGGRNTEYIVGGIRENKSKPWQKPWLEVATRLCRVDDGIPRRMDRVNRLKALGNAIVPQVVVSIMQAIKQCMTFLYF